MYYKYVFSIFCTLISIISVLVVDRSSVDIFHIYYVLLNEFLIPLIETLMAQRTKNRGQRVFRRFALPLQYSRIYIKIFYDKEVLTAATVNHGLDLLLFR